MLSGKKEGIGALDDGVCVGRIGGERTPFELTSGSVMEAADGEALSARPVEVGKGSGALSVGSVLGNEAWLAAGSWLAVGNWLIAGYWFAAGSWPAACKLTLGSARPQESMLGMGCMDGVG